MTTFRLRRFAEPNALKAIEVARLRTFLSRFSGYFTRRGIDLQADAAIDYEALAAILMSPDEEVPGDMVDALYFVHEMSHDDAVERMLTGVRAKKIELDLGDTPTAADVAIAVWLADPNALRDLHAEAFVSRPRRFEYHAGALGAARPFPKFDHNEIAGRLDVWFGEHWRGSGTKVYAFQHGDKVHILIRHGATMRREGSIKKGEHDVAYYRPEVHDVLMYDCTQDVLGVKAGTRGERELYLQTFGDVVFQDPNYFRSGFDLSLQPLRDFGPGALQCEDVPGMTSVVLVEVKRLIGGPHKERLINQAVDLFKAFGADWYKRLGFGRLVSATFEVRLGEGGAKRKRRVTIVPPREAKFDRDDDDAETIERWLMRRGIMPKSGEDEHEAVATPSLEGVAGPSNSDDRAAGMEASAG
jgi:hypothetical protein